MPCCFWYIGGMLLWTCLHCSPKSYLKLIRLTLLFYSCLCILLTGNTYKQPGCNATGWLLFRGRSCSKSQVLAVSESSGVSVIYRSQVSPKTMHLMDVVLREICCYVPFCLPDIFYMGKPCYVLLKKHLQSNCLFLFPGHLPLWSMFCLDCSEYYSGFSEVSEANARENNVSLILFFCPVHSCVLPIIVPAFLTSGTEATIIVSYLCQKGRD